MPTNLPKSLNIGFAAITMNKDLGFTASQFGFGAGIFFLGYVLFELPSNIVLSKFGARRRTARILITWSIVSAVTAFVWNPASFHVVRVLLGAAKAGFFPVIIFFMTLWFPARILASCLGRFRGGAGGEWRPWVLVAVGVVTGPVDDAQLVSGQQHLCQGHCLARLEGARTVDQLFRVQVDKASFSGPPLRLSASRSFPQLNSR